MENIIDFSGRKNSSELILKILFVLILFFISLALSASHIIIDTLNSYQWNSRKHDWVAFERKIMVYNDKNKLSEITQILCKKSWTNYSMRSYIYDKSTVLHEMTEKFWSENLRTWTNNYREIYKYNDNMQVDSIIHYNIFEEKVFDDAIELITYNPDGRPLTKIYKQYVDQWTNLMMYEYRYDGNNITCESVSYWDQEKWEKPLYKTSYQYDEYGRLVKLIKRQRKNMDDYQSINCEHFQYDKNGIILKQSSQVWDHANGNWEETSKTEYTSDHRRNIASGITSLCEEGNCYNFQRDEYIADQNIMPAKAVSGDLSFWVVPSRFKNSMTIEFDNPENLLFRVRIMNSKGSVINQTEIPDNRITLDTRNISKGEYFIEVSGDGRFAGKFIID